MSSLENYTEIVIAFAALNMLVAHQIYIAAELVLFISGEQKHGHALNNTSAMKDVLSGSCPEKSYPLRSESIRELPSPVLKRILSFSSLPSTDLETDVRSDRTFE